MTDLEGNSVDVTLQRAAEEVRQHLVMLRGGAPFLSPKDSALLVIWLEEGIPVSEIIIALEKAADSRRKRRSRLPLTLSKAKRYLRKIGQKAPSTTPSSSSHPFEQIAVQVEANGQPRLSEELLSLDSRDREQLLRNGLRCVRQFLQHNWDQMPDNQRNNALDRARLTVESWNLDYDEASLQLASEELARDEIRRNWPMLSSTVLADAIEGARR